MNSTSKMLDEKLRAFEERMEARKPENTEREDQRKEELRQAYLKRTNRREMRSDG